MKDFRTLKFLDLFKELFERCGINYLIMRRILAVKLTMDGRRVSTVFNQQSKKKKKSDEENGFVKSLWIYTLLGVMLIPFVSFGTNYLFQMSIFFGVVMFLVMTSMISDFSSVLLDVRDKGILGTKPVDKRTINTAKTIHICIYLFFLTASFTALPVIIGTYKHGMLFLILSVLGLILMDLFIVVLTALIYYFILRFFDGEKLKDIINFVQIGLSISIAVGYQVLARAFSFVDMKIVFSPAWWQFFLPPIWFGAPFELLLRNDTNSYLIIFSTMAFLLPVISMIIYHRMMPSFERNLQKLTNNSGKSKRKYNRFKNWLAHLLCRNPEERAFFRFADNMMRNEREFRLKVYPALGLALVFPFIFLFNQLQMSTYSQLTASKWYLAVYMCNMMIPNAVSMLKYSGKYKGSWIYRTAPLKSMAPLFSSTLKVFIVNLYLPIFIVLSVIFIGIFGLKIILDLLVIFVSSILFTVICSSFLKGTLPFSDSFEDANQGANIKIFLSLLIIFILGAVHYFLIAVPFGVLGYFILLLIVTIFAWKQAYKTIWDFS